MNSEIDQVLDDLETVEARIRVGMRPLVLFSGGLDGAYLLARLGNRIGVALTVDLGGDPLSAAALQLCQKLGVRHRVVDAKAIFCNDFVKPAMYAPGVYVRGHPICASLSRPCIAQVALRIAAEYQCDMILHTSDYSQNSLRRFNGSLCQLGYKGHFGSPFARTRVTREEKIRFLNECGFSGYAAATISGDSNLWGREFEHGELDDPERIVEPEELFVLTGRAQRVSCNEECVLRFESGDPVWMNGECLWGPELVSRVGGMGGRHGLGRFVELEETQSGQKVQEIREMPAAVILMEAYRRLESACMPYATILQREAIGQIWTREAVEGRWFGALRLACQAFMDVIAKGVRGEVWLEMQDGRLRCTRIVVPEPRYVRRREDVKMP